MVKKPTTLNCLDSFLALFRGTTSEAQINDLIEYMIKSSYFFSKDCVEERYETMCKLLSLDKNPNSNKGDLNAEKNGYFYCRFSTVKDENSPYFKDCRCETQIPDDKRSSKTKLLNYQKDNDVYYCYNPVDSKESFCIKVKIDNDGNSAVRSLINKVCGYWVSNGAKSTIKNATISHIWGNASNPLFFTSLWNIVVVPTFCNFILEKNEIKNENDDEEEDQKYIDIINRVNNTFKAICWKMYGVENKQFDGKIIITKPEDNYLKLADAYINLIPADHILGKTECKC